MQMSVSKIAGGIVAICGAIGAVYALLITVHFISAPDATSAPARTVPQVTPAPVGTQAPLITLPPNGGGGGSDTATTRAVTSVVGMNLSEAEARLRNDGFLFDEVSQSGTGQSAFQVVRTDPPVGTQVAKGSRIIVYFAFGP
jgi:hypothetical protein